MRGDEPERLAVRRFDMVVIGGGAGGLVAAKEARRRKASVAIVQDGPIGGDCTFTGCIPSKSLLAAAAAGQGFDQAMASVRAAVTAIAATEDAAALRHEGIEVIPGRGRFTSRREVTVDGGLRVRARRFIVATGARPYIPAIPGLADAGPLTSETLFSLDHRPRSLVVLGGGPVGCEMAQAFARLGCTVTLLEARTRLLSRDEPEAAAVVGRALEADGVRVQVSARVHRVERPGADRIAVHLDDGTVLESTHLLVAVGRAPAGRGIGLEELGATVDDDGAVVVADDLSTGVAGIWAVGDVTGRWQFTHVAGRMGWLAATNALSRLARVRPFRFDTTATPWVTFTGPEVAHVGMGLAAAAAAHPGARVAHLPLSHVDRAVTSGATDGFVRLIAAPRRGSGHLGGGRLVGATIVAPTAGELIHEAALAIQTRMFAGRLAQTPHAYPSWSMAVQQAALQFFGTSAGLRARPIEAVLAERRSSAT